MFISTAPVGAFVIYKGVFMERIDLVPGTSYKIIQDKDSFSYGTDAIFLSDFARPKGEVIDLGTGTGIIPLRIVDNPKVGKIYGIEIQEEVYARAKRSIEENNLEEKISILNLDLRNIKDHFKKAQFQTVVSNPPYLKKGSAIINKDENFAISRHEIKCDLLDVIQAANYLLMPQGKFFLVHRPDRLVDILYNLREYNMEAKRIRFVYPKYGKASNLILVEGVKGGKADLKFMEPLIVYKKDGSYTEEILKIYGRK